MLLQRRVRIFLPYEVVSAGRAVEALVLAILDGHHALYKVGRHLDERGMLPLLQPGLEPQSLHDTGLGQTLDALPRQLFHPAQPRAALRPSVHLPLGREMEFSTHFNDAPRGARI